MLRVSRVTLSRSFGPERRIKRRAEYLQIQKVGRKVRSSHFLVSTTRRPSPELCSRVGITITTKIDKRSARRNRLRRRVRELFRSCPCIRSAADIVIIAQQGSTELTFQEIKGELTELLGRAKLLKRGPGGA